jgi:hypothetical protein
MAQISQNERLLLVRLPINIAVKNASNPCACQDIETSPSAVLPVRSYIWTMCLDYGGEGHSPYHSVHSSRRHDVWTLSCWENSSFTLSAKYFILPRDLRHRSQVFEVVTSGFLYHIREPPDKATVTYMSPANEHDSPRNYSFLLP